MRVRQYVCLESAISAGILLLQSEPASADFQVRSEAASLLRPASAERILPSGQEALEPIIVTARRLPERLQRTPISIVTLSANALERASATSLLDLQYLIPSVTIAPSQNVGDAAGNFFIRGIGQEDFVAGSEPGVGVYLDNVYVARTMGSLMELIDIDRVEVLRGPQGTLYGRNAIGGTINVISAAPSPRDHYSLSLLAANLGRAEIRGMANTTLSDSLSVRLTAGLIRRGGFLRRLASPSAAALVLQTNREQEGAARIAAGRVQIRWLPSSSLGIDISADFSSRRGTQSATHVDEINPDFGILPTINSLVSDGRLPGPAITDALVTKDLLSSFAGGGNSIAQNIEGVAATVTRHLARHSIKLILAYRGLRSNVATDLDGSWLPILQGDFAERHRQYSAEIQAHGTRGPLTYTGGLILLTERMRSQSLRGAGRVDVLYLCGCFYPAEARPLLFFPRRRLTGDNLAVFAQGNFELTSVLTATLGARWSHERKSTEAQLLRIDPETIEPTEVVLRSASDSAHWNSFTWRLGFDFQATQKLMLYASAAEGYKSGGFNARLVANLPNLGIDAFAPERARTYEAGFRSEWYGGRLRLNATIFSTYYRDIQLRQQTFSEGILTTLIGNASRARIRGVEVELATHLSPRLRTNFSFGFLAPRFLELGAVPNLTLSSNFQRTPHASASASFEYSIPLRRHTIFFSGNYGYRSREQFQLTASPYDQPAHGLFGGRITLREHSDRWSIALFGRNLTDERYRLAGRGTGVTGVGFANSVIGLPRQIGIQFKIGF